MCMGRSRGGLTTKIHAVTDARGLPITRHNALPARDRDAYRRRTRIERFFSKPDDFRAAATRYAKHDASFRALVKRAATRIWLRVYGSVS